MLNKVKWGIAVGVVLSALKLFLPEVDFPEGLQDAIVLIAIFASQFWVKETQASVGDLAFK